MLVGTHVELAAQFLCPLAHARQPDSLAGARGQAVAVVGHLDLQVLAGGQDDLADLGASMPRHVRHRFQHDAICGDLDGGRKRVGPLTADLEPGTQR